MFLEYRKNLFKNLRIFVELCDGNGNPEKQDFLVKNSDEYQNVLVTLVEKNMTTKNIDLMKDVLSKIINKDLLNTLVTDSKYAEIKKVFM